MRIYAGKHALDGIFEQGFVVNGFNIGIANLIEHLSKDADFIKWQRQIIWTRLSCNGSFRGRDFSCWRCNWFLCCKGPYKKSGEDTCRKCAAGKRMGNKVNGCELHIAVPVEVSY